MLEKLITATNICNIMTKLGYEENWNKKIFFCLISDKGVFKIKLREYENYKQKIFSTIIHHHHHWTCLFAFYINETINFYYCDSFGKDLPISYKTVIDQFYKKYNFEYNKKIQQFDNFNCGIYTIINYFYILDNLFIKNNIFFINKNMQKNIHNKERINFYRQHFNSILKNKNEKNNNLFVNL